jgi:hypothetical protein
MVAVAAGVPWLAAWLYPLMADGLALVAYAATIRLSGWAAAYAWAVVVLAAGLSGIGQAAYLGGVADGAAWGLRAGVGAWPALAAAVTAHLLWLLVDRSPKSHKSPQDVHLPAEIATPLAEDVSSAPPADPAELIAQGYGRKRLAKALAISEHAARDLIDEHRTNGVAR